MDYEFTVESDADHRAWPILLLAADPSSAEQLVSLLGGLFTIQVASSSEEAERSIQDLDYAAVIVDLAFEGGRGAALLARFAELKPATLRVVVGDSSDSRSILQTINRVRAYSFIARPWTPASLLLAIRGAVERYAVDEQNRRLMTKLEEERRALADQVAEQTQALREANERLRTLAISDGLTGIYNHRYFQERFKHEVGVASRYGRPLSLILLDLDHFKTYNDSLGHPQGDILIREAASLIAATVREVDLVARYGGDEFAVALPGADKGHSLILAERIRRVLAGGAFERSDVLPGGRLTVSVGVATFPHDGSDHLEVLSSADRALYRAKECGRDRVEAAHGYEEGAGTADREADFHLVVDEDGSTHHLTPRPGELSSLQALLENSDIMQEILEDGDTMEHPAAVPNLASAPHALRADIIGSDSD